MSAAAPATTTPSWATKALTLRGSVAVGPDDWGLACDLLGEQPPAHNLFVVLGKAGTPPRIESADYLELGENVHGLFSVAELGHSDKEVEEFYALQWTLQAYKQAIAEARADLADAVVEMIRERTTLAFLPSHSLATGFRILQAKTFDRKLETLRQKLDHCVALQEETERKIDEFRQEIMWAVERIYKPTRYPLSVGTFLRLRATNTGGEPLGF